MLTRQLKPRDFITFNKNVHDQLTVVTHSCTLLWSENQMNNLAECTWSARFRITIGECEFDQIVARGESNRQLWTDNQFKCKFAIWTACGARQNTEQKLILVHVSAKTKTRAFYMLKCFHCLKNFRVPQTIIFVFKNGLHKILIICHPPEAFVARLMLLKLQMTFNFQNLSNHGES